MDTIDLMIAGLLGTRYHWGGNSAPEGFDCSGFVCELLKAQGLLSHKEDYSASQLFSIFRDNQTSKPRRGTLVFYGKNLASITHVGYCINPTQMVEAGGGNSEVTNLETAIKKQACVRIRPINYRSDLLVMVNP
jgi:cell wall-associated NlpC family hydrolase